MPPAVRPAEASDADFLAEMVAVAAFWRPQGPSGTVPGVLSRPELAHYVVGWPRPGDLGVLAVDGQRPVGAAWLRLSPESDPGYGFVDAATPELSMGVVQAWRKCGVGRRLLDALVAAAREQGLASLSLRVEVDNYARRLYERVGFRQVGEVNGSVTMLLRLGVPSDRRPEKRPGAPEQVNRRDHSRTSRAANSSLESHDGLDM
jgi:GNAT superfamily N-acetyltransferase